MQRELARVIVGAEDVIRALCIALHRARPRAGAGPAGTRQDAAGEDASARVLGGEFKRVQGTADLMPSDIVGTHVFDASKNEFVFRRGPLFADVLLVDEINRTGPKTQSALLEAMEERQVSSERDHVSAAGRLPGAGHAEPARLRRHLSTAGVTARSLHAAHRHELSRARRGRRDPQALWHRARGARSDPGRHRRHRSRAAAPGARGRSALHVSEALSNYVLDLAHATREHPRVALGLSTRGALALHARGARARRACAVATSSRPTTCRPWRAGCWRTGWCSNPKRRSTATRTSGVVGAILDATARCLRLRNRRCTSHSRGYLFVALTALLGVAGRGRTMPAFAGAWLLPGIPAARRGSRSSLVPARHAGHRLACVSTTRLKLGPAGRRRLRIRTQPARA